MNLYLIGIIFVFLSTALAVVGMLVVRAKVGVSSLSTNHEVAGYLLSIIGTLYAVLLGFVVVDAMEKQEELRVIVEKEASGVANMFLTSNGLLNDANRKNIQDSCYKYTVTVINDEWPAMEEGTYSAEAFEHAWALWKLITTLKTENEDERVVKEQLLSEMCSMTENRRTRLVAAQLGMAPIMWVVLIVGGVFTVLFTYFFAVESVKAHIMMTILVAMTLSLNGFLVFIFAYPISGDIGVKPDAFKQDLLIFKRFNEGTIKEGLELPSK